jgi:hypothetical protein
MASQEAYQSSWEVKAYYLLQRTGGGSQEEDRAIIVLGGEAGTAMAAFVYFTTAAPLQVDFWHPILGVMIMHCHYEQFAPMMEMLREERPIWVHPFGEGGHHISTMAEPIGESELPS